MPRPNCHQVGFPYIVYKVVVADFKGLKGLYHEIVRHFSYVPHFDNEVFLGYARIILPFFRCFSLIGGVREIFYSTASPCFPLVGGFANCRQVYQEQANHFLLFSIIFNCAVLFFNYVYIFPTKAHPPCTYIVLCYA
jgi:hypothetical protein